MDGDTYGFGRIVLDVTGLVLNVRKKMVIANIDYGLTEMVMHIW